jgi:hypothetical protein
MNINQIAGILVLVFLIVALALLIPGGIFTADEFGFRCPPEFTDSRTCIARNVTADHVKYLERAKNDTIAIPLLILGSFSVIMGAIAALVCLAHRPPRTEPESESLAPEQLENDLRTWFKYKFAKARVYGRKQLRKRIDRKRIAPGRMIDLAIECGAKSAKEYRDFIDTWLDVDPVLVVEL